MQELLEQNHLWSTRPRLVILISIFSLVMTMLAIKGFTEGWFEPRYPLDIKQQPAILFFNRHKGCDCALVVYQAAANQVQDWSEEDRQGVQLIPIDLDQRPDLGAQFGVIRAPSLLLVDRNGEIKYRQDEVVTDAEPLNLSMIEGKIGEVVNGN